jgi:hypothetical protein
VRLVESHSFLSDLGLILVYRATAFPQTFHLTLSSLGNELHDVLWDMQKVQEELQRNA